MNIKRLVLGTAAGALAVTGAHAADLPVVVEPVDYVRICDAYGTGFYFIPGTETCLRVGGRIRTDYNLYFDLDEGDGFFEGNGFENWDDRGYRFRARGYIRLDSRTATEFGLLRTYIDFFGTVDSAARGAGPVEDFELDSAFIQFGGLTFGRTSTFYGFGLPGIGSRAYLPEQTFDLGNNTGQVNVVAYTAAFGNGFSASIALEDTTDHRGNGIIGGVYGGAKVPDLVANLRVDQGWGSAQVMGALRYVEAATPGGVVGFYGDDIGFAVGAGVNVNVPFGTGTVVGIQAGYAKGALDYIADGPSGRGAADARFTPGGNFDLGDFFSVAGGFATMFTPTIGLAAGAGYVYMDHSGSAFDTQNFNAQAFLNWTPVSGFGMGVGAEYRYVDNDTGADGGALTTWFRAQRDF